LQSEQGDKRVSTPDLLWHYTTPQGITDIFHANQILPTSCGILQDEKPVVWFSANQEWEKTAWKGLRNKRTGEIRELYTREDMVEVLGTLYRVGVKRELLKPWVRLKKLGRIRPEMARELENVAIRLGASAYDWWGTIFPVGVAQWESVQELVLGEWKELPKVAKKEQAA